MKRKDYGGAYDIEPDMYWTRDDLNELWSAAEWLDIKNREMDGEGDFRITAMYLDENDMLDVKYEDRYGNEYHLDEEIRIDKRAASTARELCDKYAPVLTDAIHKELEKYYEQIKADWQQER